MCGHLATNTAGNFQSSQQLQEIQRFTALQNKLPPDLLQYLLSSDVWIISCFPTWRQSLVLPWLKLVPRIRHLFLVLCKTTYDLCHVVLLEKYLDWALLKWANHVIPIQDGGLIRLIGMSAFEEVNPTNFHFFCLHNQLWFLMYKKILSETFQFLIFDFLMVTLGLVLHLMCALDDCITEKMTSLWLAEIRPINRNRPFSKMAAENSNTFEEAKTKNEYQH